MGADSWSGAIKGPWNFFVSLRRPRGKHVINPNVDLVIHGLAGKPRGYRMDKMAIRKRPQMKIDSKLQQQMQICCGMLKCIIMTMTHAGVCAVRRRIDVKTKNSLRTQGLGVVKSFNMFCIAKLIEEWFHDATKYTLEIKRQNYFFTRGQFWPSGIVVASLRLSVRPSVRPSAYPPPAHPTLMLKKIILGPVKVMEDQ